MIFLIQLLFILIALAMVVACFFPNWAISNGPVVVGTRVVSLLVGLVILAIVYLVFMAVLGVTVPLPR